MRRLLMTAVVVVGASSAEAATVKDVNAKKKIVAIELEEDETIEKGAEVCFFTESGKKVDCGTVSKVKGTLGSVKMKSKKKLKRIKPGMVAKVGSTPPGEGGEEGGKDAPAAQAGGSKKVPFRVWGFYSPALATPGVFNKLGYEAPTDAAPGTLWKADKAVTQALFAFNLQVGIPLGSMSLNPGFRYRSFTPSLIDADYIPQRENPYVSTEQEASALGVFFDFQFLRAPLSPAFALNLASGLDIDMSTVTLKATKKDDTGATPEGNVAKATSKLTVISLRLGAGFDFVFAKPLGLSFGTTLMVPLAEAGKAFTGAIEDNEDRGQEDPGEDLKAALGHKKGAFGAEISLGAVLAF